MRYFHHHYVIIRQELINYEDQIKKITQDIDRLKVVLKNIHDHNAFLRSQYEAYKKYLNDVRLKTSKPADGKKIKPKGPFKYTHKQLVDMGVIVESEVPEDRYILGGNL